MRVRADCKMHGPDGACYLVRPGYDSCSSLSPGSPGVGARRTQIPRPFRGRGAGPRATAVPGHFHGPARQLTPSADGRATFQVTLIQATTRRFALDEP